MSQAGLEILYEDNHLLAINKPAGLATMGVAADAPSVVTLAKQYIKQKYRKPGGVYLGIVSRLDTPTTGIVLLARTSKAASRLAQQFRERDAAKTYWAIVAGSLRRRRANWSTGSPRTRPGSGWSSPAPGTPTPKKPVCDIANCASRRRLAVGDRSAQRTQAPDSPATGGARIPDLGRDEVWPRAKFADGLALHSRRLVVEHPTRRVPLELLAPLPTCVASPGHRRLDVLRHTVQMSRRLKTTPAAIQARRPRPATRPCRATARCHRAARTAAGSTRALPETTSRSATPRTAPGNSAGTTPAAPRTRPPAPGRAGRSASTPASPAPPTATYRQARLANTTSDRDQSRGRLASRHTERRTSCPPRASQQHRARDQPHDGFRQQHAPAGHRQRHA